MESINSILGDIEKTIDEADLNAFIIGVLIPKCKYFNFLRKFSIFDEFNAFWAEEHLDIDSKVLQDLINNDYVIVSDPKKLYFKSISEAHYIFNDNSIFNDILFRFSLKLIKIIVNDSRWNIWINI